MASNLEYDFRMKAAKLAAVAGLALASALCLPPATASAQQAVPHGVAPSVTSPDFGGRGAARGVPPSVTSLGFGQQRFGTAPQTPLRNHRSRNGYGYGGYYYYPFGYGYGYAEDAPIDAPDDDQYQGGPTIFDRRGQGPTASEARTNYSRPPGSQRAELASTPADAEPAAAQPPTILIFKDGHEYELANYAIVGSTLYDLSDGRRHKIALSELDLAATVKQNDARGLDFEVPASAN